MKTECYCHRTWPTPSNNTPVQPNAKEKYWCHQTRLQVETPKQQRPHSIQAKISQKDSAINAPKVQTKVRRAADHAQTTKSTSIPTTQSNLNRTTRYEWKANRTDLICLTKDQQQISSTQCHTQISLRLKLEDAIPPSIATRLTILWFSVVKEAPIARDRFQRSLLEKGN